MRVIWKDSAVKRVDLKYRGYEINGYSNGGWTTNFPGDNNIYRTNRCVKNMIDEKLGLEGRRVKSPPERLQYGYEIIGKRNDKTG